MSINFHAPSANLNNLLFPKVLIKKDQQMSFPTILVQSSGKIIIGQFKFKLSMCGRSINQSEKSLLHNLMKGWQNTG